MTSHELSLNSRYFHFYAAVCTLCYTFTKKDEPTTTQQITQQITTLVLRHLGVLEVSFKH